MKGILSISNENTTRDCRYKFIISMATKNQILDMTPEE